MRHLIRRLDKKFIPPCFSEGVFFPQLDTTVFLPVGLLGPGSSAAEIYIFILKF